MQKVIITGNIGNDATTTQGQKPQYRFSVGVFNGRNSEGDIETVWYTVFSPQLQRLEGRLTKGAKVSVIGTLRPEIYVGSDGIAKLDLTVNADNIDVHDGGLRSGEYASNPGAPQGYPQPGAPQQSYRQGLAPAVAAGAAAAAQNAYRQQAAAPRVAPRPAAPQSTPFDDLPL